jgi:hypothetical protein
MATIGWLTPRWLMGNVYEKAVATPVDFVVTVGV